MTDEEDIKLSRASFDDDDPRPRRSVSQLTEYITCGEKFRLNRIVRPRVPKKPAAWLVMGIAIHEALEKREIKGHDDDLMSDYLEAFDRVQAEQLAVQPDLTLWINPFRGKNVLQSLEAYREKGIGQVNRFLEWINDPERLAGVFSIMRDAEDGEPWVEVPFDMDLGGIRVIGFIDRVEEGGEPVDIKSGDKKNNKDLQLGVYKVAMEKQFGISPTVGQFFMTKVDGRSVFGYTEFVDLTRYTEQYVTELFQAAERGIQNEVFLPHPQDFCGICDVQEFCREKGYPGRIIPLNWQDVENPWWVVDIDPDQ